MKKDFIPVGVLVDKKHTGMLVQNSYGTTKKLFLSWSVDGIQFKEPTREVIIYLKDTKKEIVKHCSNFQFLKTIDGWVMSYTRHDSKGKNCVIALSHDLYTWNVLTSFITPAKSAAIIPSISKKTTYLMYSGDTFFRLLKSPDLKRWIQEPGLLMTSRNASFDAMPLTIIGGFNTKKGNLIIYDASYASGDIYTLQAGAVLFSKQDPKKILWRSESPLWKSVVHSNSPLMPLGSIVLDKTIHLYWTSEEGDIITVAIAAPFVEDELLLFPQQYLTKFHNNPIIEPHDDNHWETEAVFNPAALYDGERIHLLYRAIGNNGISVLGYASSTDGFDFDHRLNYPVFEPTEGYGLPHPEVEVGPRVYNPAEFTSGGGWSGCEDPRLVKIGKRIYMTYLAFGGWNSMRLALTSISERDLHLKRWNWTDPLYLSPPGEVHKNWVLFPEKINGKFAFLHSISPDICIHYTTSLKDFDGKTFIKSKAPQGGRKEYWDSKVRGAGPPPLKTKLGWLLLYHANDSREPHKYKLGAMILDKKDPTKILYRTSHPILIPNECYENNGKPGIVYASGSVIKDDQLFVYYGGADRVVCVASTPLKDFLKKIQDDVKVSFKPFNTITI